MSDNAEEGIARAQARAAQAGGAAGLDEFHKGSVSYLNERILTFLLIVGVVGLFVLWATAKSPWLLYGSLVAVIVLVILWGVARVRRRDAIERQRAREAASWEADKPS